jgi:hypothetical protein
MDLNSSFGPFGKLKICHDATGSIVLTKDGNQLYEYQIRGNTLQSVADFLKKRSLSLAQENGDGFLTTSIVVETLSYKLITDLQCNKPVCINSRIGMLAALAAISNVLSQSYTSIASSFVANRLWDDSTNNVCYMLQSLCYNLISSGSDKETANSLSRLIVSSIALEFTYKVFVDCLEINFLSNSQIGC